MATNVIRSRAFLTASDFLTPVSRALDRGVTVTPFVLEGSDGSSVMEFEIVVKKIGTNTVPRITNATARKAR